MAQRNRAAGALEEIEGALAKGRAGESYSKTLFFRFSNPGYPGRVMTNSVPSPSRLSTSRVPPWPLVTMS